MKTSIEFFFDFVSPYSYLASSRLNTLDAGIQLRPMKLLELMKLVGNVPTTVTCKAKNRYASNDLRRWVGRYGVPFNPSDIRAVDAGACSRAVLSAANSDEANAVTHVLFRNVWGEGNTLRDSSEVIAALRMAGLDTTTLQERIDSPEIATALDSNTGEAAERGVFGAPTFFVGDAMFFGNDRLDFVRQELAARAEAA